MAFQFQCPQGHLLEGDPSQAGQACTCPMCGVMFIIPQPIAAPAPAAPQYSPAPQYPAPPQYPAAHQYSPAPAASYPPAPAQFPSAPVAQFPATPTSQSSAPASAQFPALLAPQPGPPMFPQVGVEAPAAPVIQTETPSAGPVVDVAAAPAAPTLLHIPCPKGHELEVPPDMLNQEVLCPHCNTQFKLRERDSVEFKRKREIELERRDFKRGQAWLNWAIVAAVIVVLGLIIMIAASRS
jgi:hypothetical protein